ncbi:MULTISPECIES: hypothetical protein [unclassified Streptomyces]|uniref:hypothetical protein n=1 Tax=unclassified Streptomyces TaxID=2593676 RepID=UPI00351FEA8C
MSRAAAASRYCSPKPSPDRGALAPCGSRRGLAIVRGIVEAHQGSTTVRNVPGGCRFEVLLPGAAS